MIKIPLFSLALLSIVGCGSKSDIGLGVIYFESTCAERISFYDKPDMLANFVFHVDLLCQESGNRIRTSLKPDKDSIELYPLYLNGQEGSLTLQVLEREGDWLKVYTDDVSKVAHWVYSEEYVIKSWKEFLLDIYPVRPILRSNRLRRNPSDKADEYSLDIATLCLKVIEVNGSWLRVRNFPSGCDRDDVFQEEIEGFLRWKRGGDLLVHFSP